MNYEMFTEEIKKEVEELVKKQLGEATVSIQNITQNNNIKMCAISIVRSGDKATPNIYLKEYYNEYKNGKNIKSISEEILDIYLSGSTNFINDINFNDLNDFAKVRNKIYYRLINYDMNKEMLKNIPHIKFLDMAIVFFIMVSCREEGQAIACIKNENLSEWEISMIELRNIAFNNTWRKYPPVIKKMEDIVSDMIIDSILDDDDDSVGKDDRDTVDYVSEDTGYGEYSYEELQDMIREEVEKIKMDEDMEMYVMTNTLKSNGAACITYPGIIREFAEKMKKDIYIIPSSVHEVILIPGIDWEREEIDEIIREVNRTQLSPVEILSDHVYIYRRDKNQIEY
jgi:hypothetical protein